MPAAAELAPPESRERPSQHHCAKLTCRCARETWHTTSLPYELPAPAVVKNCSRSISHLKPWPHLCVAPRTNAANAVSFERTPRPRRLAKNHVAPDHSSGARLARRDFGAPTMQPLPALASLRRADECVCPYATKKASAAFRAGHHHLPQLTIPCAQALREPLPSAQEPSASPVSEQRCDSHAARWPSVRSRGRLLWAHSGEQVRSHAP